MSRNQLKDYLNVRGISTSGYSKIEMVTRAFSAAEMDLPIIMSSEEQACILQNEYQKMLSEFNLSDPKSLQDSDKIDDITMWPKVDTGSFFEYILRVNMFTFEYIGKYKKEKAF